MDQRGSRRAWFVPHCCPLMLPKMYSWLHQLGGPGLAPGPGSPSGLSLTMVFLALLLSHSVVSDSATLWTAACQASLSFTISQSLLSLMSIESVMLSNRLILCHPLLLLPSIFPNIKLFSSESALLVRWPKYWKFTFTFSISPSNEYSGLISFKIDWLDLLGVQGTLKSLLQHHSSKASILWCWEPAYCILSEDLE